MFKLLNLETQVMEKKEVIKVIDEDGILKIEVLEEIPVLEYLDLVDEYNLGMLPLGALFTDGFNYFSSSLVPQVIFVYTEEDKTYYVTDSSKKLKVIEYIKGTELIDEVLLEMNKKDNSFRVVKSIHDLSMSTKECKSYPCNEEHMEEFTLERLEAFNIVKDLIKRVGEVKRLDKIANVYDLYKYTNILDEKYYHQIITDGVISISKTFIDDGYDVTKKRDDFFDIILNDTREKIGEITYTLYENNIVYPDKSIRYEGNVGYKIISRYRSNHYATRALKLLIALIKDNTCDIDKDLYISTLTDNVNSQNVALNNGAVLFYEGEVPETEDLNYRDGIKDVKIYKIKI